MDELSRTMDIVRGHLGDMQADLKANTRDLSNLARRTKHLETTVSALAGTFASIERVMVKLLAEGEETRRMGSATSASLGAICRAKDSSA